MFNITFWNTLGGTLESFVTALALVVGGIWTYRAYFKQRIAFPRLDVSVAVQEVTLAKGLLIRVQISLRNSGSVIATSDSGEIRLRQVVPPPGYIEEAISAGFDPVPADCAQVEWPLLAGRRWKWEKGEFEIEPGESDSLCADFFVPLQTEVVEFYFFLANARKKKKGVGWTVSRLHYLSKSGGPNARERQGQQEVHGGAAEATTAPSSAATETTTAPTP